MSNEAKMEPMIAVKKIIDKAGIDGTLTEEAVKQFNGTITENDALRKENRQKAEGVTKLSQENQELLTKIDSLQSTVSAYSKREGELEDREHSMTRMETALKYEQIRVQDHQAMFDKVFRNIETRRNVFTPVSGLQSDQYGVSQTPRVDINEEVKTDT